MILNIQKTVAKTIKLLYIKISTKNKNNNIRKDT